MDVHWEDGQIIHVRIVPTAEIDALQTNTPATGVPTISGTAQVGETLTADTSGIADVDGLANVSYAYQWIRTDGGADADIAGATDSTYMLADDDQGKTIKLKVTFNDDKGNSETLAIVAAADVGENEQKPQFLVSNLGINVATGIMRPLNAARSGFAQAFTTGAKTGRLRTGFRRHPCFALLRRVDRGGPPPGDHQRRRERRRAGRRALHLDQSVELLGHRA